MTLAVTVTAMNNNAKRKAATSHPPHSQPNPPKKAKTTTSASKPGLLGAVELPTGLKIVRGNSRAPSPSPVPPQSHASSSRTTLDGPAVAKPHKPPSRMTTPQSSFADEHVKEMERETQALRQTPRATYDTVMAIPDSETPQINRNRRMRDDAMIRGGFMDPEESSSQSPSVSRRSSRGKRRTSSGNLALPHPSIPDEHLSRHLDMDLPQSEQAANLCNWALARAFRAMKLSPAEKPILEKVVEETRIALLQRRIDTSSSTVQNASLKPNPDNVKLNKFLDRETRDIGRFKGELDGFAASKREHFEDILKGQHAKLDQRRKALQQNRQRLSSKAQGKQRASDLPSPESSLDEAAIPPEIQRVLSLSHNLHDEYEELERDRRLRIDNQRYTIDLIHARMSSASQMVSVAADALDNRFAILRAGLKVRSDPPAPVTYPSESQVGSRVLSAYASSSSAELKQDDPKDLLRALAMMDAARPPELVSDSARAAEREVKRTEENGAVPFGKRRLTTDTMRVPGTPNQRGHTPGR
ncbi:hypothetical protein DL96DRAFT_1619968 [Flagelloscypha sp. PMI_526]|nr:hypothetical protein DL96DRAFT_1619968 [Flagelloscypha sp. PMI_526]